MDCSQALNDLLQYGKKNNISLEIDDWRQRAIYLKNSWHMGHNENSDCIQAASAISMLSGFIDKSTIVATGVGNHQMLAAQRIEMKNPKSFLTSGSFGTMGFCLPSAIGAYYANPFSKIIAIDGDGSMRMNMGELCTIIHYGIPIKIAMINNLSDGMVLNLQKASYNNETIGTKRPKDINYASIAKEMGFNYSKRLQKKEKLKETIKEFMESKGPSFLEIITDKNETLYPKVPAGKSYKEMELGPYIIPKDLK